MASPDTKIPAPDGDKHEAANVDKIRDIIFGSQMRDYEKRFSRLDERLTIGSEGDAVALPRKIIKSFRDVAGKGFNDRRRCGG